MRFGIKTNPQKTTWDALLATWKRADETEVIESAWVFDHFYPIPIHSDPMGPCMEAWTTLSALTMTTSRLRVGSMVNGMPYRHPALTANMAASMDIISGGRFELGLGAGWNQEEAGAYGISLGETLGDRMDMFDEGVEIVHKLLTQDSTTFDGKHYQLKDAHNEPKGPQKPRPPIVIGGGGEKRTLRTVAKWADHWNSTPLSPQDWLRKRAILDKHCGDVGRDPSEITNSMMFKFDASIVDQFAADAKALSEVGLDILIARLPSPHDPDHVDLVAEVANSMR